MFVRACYPYYWSFPFFNPNSPYKRIIKEKGFTVVSTDESFFFYDALVKRVWIEEDKRPVVRITSSHKHSCLFGAMSLSGKQFFRHYDKFNDDTFLEYLR